MKIHMIYLAAGNSRRFGSNKLLYQWHGQPLYQYGLKQLLEVLQNYENYTLDIITQYHEINEYISHLSIPHVHCLINPESYLGLSYSIQKGIQKYKDDQDCYFLFLVADQPYIQASTIENMIAEVMKRKSPLATIKYQDQFGSPTLFHCQFYNELMQLTGDQGGRQILKKYQNICFEYKIDNHEELNDYDYLEDIISNSIN